MGLYWPNFSLVFLIHLFLYAGVYCIFFSCPLSLKANLIFFFGSLRPPSPAKFHQHTRAQLIKKEPLLNTFLGIQAKTPL